MVFYHEIHRHRFFGRWAVGDTVGLVSSPVQENHENMGHAADGFANCINHLHNQDTGGDFDGPIERAGGVGGMRMSRGTPPVVK